MLSSLSTNVLHRVALLNNIIFLNTIICDLMLPFFSKQTDHHIICTQFISSDPPKHPRCWTSIAT